ncbi:MAG: multiprotein bridging factor aMBF1 [Nitrososphaerota archaeon]|nr:multiprotein bridging factor aMBF1 [Candidatus Bathyarchaeota archaeon]MDW8023079.1 multiprotein bridging factor aMBF1 [Nitrososphaerota archaeon]
MRCEVCGRKIQGKPIRAIIEGAKLLVCNECSRHGKIVWEELEHAQPTLKPKTTAPRPPLLKTQSGGKHLKENVEETLELVEDFDVKIRQAREKMGLTHEELGKRISEKVSVLKKIEAKKMLPDNRLAAKLEHALKIKLLIPASEEKVPSAALSKPQGGELTLGDFFKFNKEGLEEKA